MERKRFTPQSSGKLSAHALVALAVILVAFGDALAQETNQKQQQSYSDGPPPMRYIPEDVRSKLEAERDPKARTRVAIELMEDRLSRADQDVNADRFEAATGELGVYEAVVEDAVHYLHASGRQNKMRDIFKRLELALREQVPHLETIRRSLPASHAVYVKEAIEFVQDQRDMALNSFYGDTVLPEDREARDKPPIAERAKGGEPAVSAAEKKPEQH